MWSRDYRDILIPRRSQWDDAQGPDRKDLELATIKLLVARRAQLTDWRQKLLPDATMAVQVHNFFKNKCPKLDNPTPADSGADVPNQRSTSGKKDRIEKDINRLTYHFTAFEIARAKYEEEWEALMKRYGSEASGSGLGPFNKARANFRETIGDDAWNTCKETAKAYNSKEREIPPDIQARFADIGAERFMKGFVEEAYRTMGIHVFGFYSHDTSDQDGGSDCKVQQFETKVNNSFGTQYTRNIVRVQDDYVEFLGKGVQKRTAPIEAEEALIQQDGIGYPILEDLDRMKRTAVQRQSLFRNTLNAAYRAAVDPDASSIPWSKMTDKITGESLIIDPVCLPPDRAPPCDPSSLKAPEIKTLYEHFYSRQQSGHLPIVFLKPLSAFTLAKKIQLDKEEAYSPQAKMAVLRKITKRRGPRHRVRSESPEGDEMEILVDQDETREVASRKRKSLTDVSDDKRVKKSRRHTSDRISLLKGLATLPWYLEFIDNSVKRAPRTDDSIAVQWYREFIHNTVQGVPCTDSSIEESEPFGPSWLSFETASATKMVLPPDFFQDTGDDSLSSTLAWLETRPHLQGDRGELRSRKFVELVALAIGLVISNLSVACISSTDPETETPDWLKACPWDHKFYYKSISALRDMFLAPDESNRLIEEEQEPGYAIPKEPPAPVEEETPELVRVPQEPPLPAEGEEPGPVRVPERPPPEFSEDLPSLNFAEADPTVSAQLLPVHAQKFYAECHRRISSTGFFKPERKDAVIRLITAWYAAEVTYATFSVPLPQTDVPATLSDDCQAWLKNQMKSYPNIISEITPEAAKWLTAAYKQAGSGGWVQRKVLNLWYVRPGPRGMMAIVAIFMSLLALEHNSNLQPRVSKDLSKQLDKHIRDFPDVFLFGRRFTGAWFVNNWNTSAHFPYMQ